MKRTICIFFVVLLLMSSCASDRYISSRSKPEIIETGYNLIRAKLNKLGLLEKYVVEMDTASCWHIKRKNYHGSWFAELLDIGETEESFEYGYILKVVGKPYWKSWEYFSLKQQQQIFYTASVKDSSTGKVLCLETLPDTSLSVIPISFTEILNEKISAEAEEVIAIAQKTFQLDTQFRCSRALPNGYFRGLNFNVDYSAFGEYYRMLSSDIWIVDFEIQPSDSIAYYELKERTTKSHQEILQIIRDTRKADAWFFRPEFVLCALVNVADKRVFRAGLDYRQAFDISQSSGPQHFSAIEAILQERIRKWREANADYIKSKQ